VRRRELIAAIGGALFARPVLAADRARTVRIGVLAPAPLRPIDSLKQRLHERGWIEGQNVQFEFRWAGSDDKRYPALAAELAALPVDAIITWSTPAVLGAKLATATIPIIMAAIADPVGVGAVSNLSRPAGNVTGFSTQNRELEAKRLELLREFVPGMKRIALLGNADNPYSIAALKQIQGLAEQGGLKADIIGLEIPIDLQAGLASLTRSRPDGVVVIAAPALFPYRKELAEFMALHRLPAIYPFREFAEAGGLIAYATNFDELFRQAADYVDKILNGTPPGDLPVQQAAKFELVINSRAANGLGLSIPPVLLSRADEVIE
jgi:putative tryptophan/tyrosine transport system substrate-binding protein